MKTIQDVQNEINLMLQKISDNNKLPKDKIKSEIDELFTLI